LKRFIIITPGKEKAMDALFQIGKELASLEARVKSIEVGRGAVKSESLKLKDAALPKEQLATIRQIRSIHVALAAEFNKVLRDLKLPENLVLGRVTLVDRASLVGVDDLDQCCMSCLNGSGGYEYCCDYAGCSCCD
jgi:hypothetical protein